jgi:hypothetical protein
MLIREADKSLCILRVSARNNIFFARGDAKSTEFLFINAERRKARNAKKMNIKKFPFFSPFRAFCVEKILKVRFQY